MRYAETNQQVAYNAGRDMFLKGWAKECPYNPKTIYAKRWWRGWFDAERSRNEKANDKNG